jgi:hypothetical protein
MKKFLLYLLFFTTLGISNAQSSLEKMGILLPKELKEWEFIKDHIEANQLFKNASQVKAFITKRNEPVKIYVFYKYHPESNINLIPNVTFYIFPNVLPIGDYPNMVTDFFEKNRAGLKGVKDIVIEVFLNGDVPEYLQHYSYIEPQTINNKKVDVSVNMVQALVFKPDYILFIDSYEPIEPKFDSPNIYNRRAKEEIVKLIKEIKITDEVKVTKTTVIE